MNNAFILDDITFENLFLWQKLFDLEGLLISKKAQLYLSHISYDYRFNTDIFMEEDIYEVEEISKRINRYLKCEIFRVEDELTYINKLMNISALHHTR